VFGGTVVSDCYVNYFADDANIESHQLCCAHLVRELKWADEVYRPSVSMDRNVNGVPHPQPWAAELVTVLQSAMAGKADYDTTVANYARLVEVGLATLSAPTKDSYRRERDTWNLLVRLRDHQDEVLGFMTQEARSVDLPPTNNSAEQAVKPHKVRQRRSGCFRSIDGAREYLVVQSYLRSAVLSGVDPLEAITRALAGDPWLPDLG
jgi:transposase